MCESTETERADDQHGQLNLCNHAVFWCTSDKIKALLAALVLYVLRRKLQIVMLWFGSSVSTPVALGCVTGSSMLLTSWNTSCQKSTHSGWLLCTYAPEKMGVFDSGSGSTGCHFTFVIIFIFVKGKDFF